LPSTFEKAVIACTAHGDIEFVQTGLLEGRRQLEVALLNLQSAEKIFPEDLTGSLSQAYDASRKALQALLAAHGIRVRQASNSHVTFVKISSASVFDRDAWVDLDWMRRLLNQAEYPSVNGQHLTVENCQEAIEAAQRMVADAQRLLSELA
jgi:HEPN domain-containing protein